MDKHLRLRLVNDLNEVLDDLDYTYISAKTTTLRVHDSKGALEPLPTVVAEYRRKLADLRDEIQHAG